MPDKQIIARAGKGKREGALAPARKVARTKGAAGRSIAAKKAARIRTMRAKAH
jgi:hypothetical protein